MSIRAASESPFRSADDFLRQQRDTRWQDLSAEPSEIPAGTRAAYSRRLARSVGGATALLGAGVLVATAIVRSTGARVGTQMRVHPAYASLTVILMASAALSLVMYGLGRLVAAGHLARALARQRFDFSDDVRTDLARLERWTVARRAAELTRALEAASVALPLAGSALLTPLALHLPVGWLLASDRSAFAGSFDQWILLSMALVGHAHVILALLGWNYARRLRCSSNEAAEPPYGGLRAWLAACAAGAAPGAVFALVPPTIVAVTGAVFVPASYVFLRRAVLSERAVLATEGP